MLDCPASSLSKSERPPPAGSALRASRRCFSAICSSNIWAWRLRGSPGGGSSSSWGSPKCLVYAGKTHLNGWYIGVPPFHYVLKILSSFAAWLLGPLLWATRVLTPVPFQVFWPINRWSLLLLSAFLGQVLRRTCTVNPWFIRLGWLSRGSWNYGLV